MLKFSQTYPLLKTSSSRKKRRVMRKSRMSSDRNKQLNQFGLCISMCKTISRSMHIGAVLKYINGIEHNRERYLALKSREEGEKMNEQEGGGR